MPDLDRFLEDLSSREPVPGGGSVAALSTAMGASLLAMVANLTIGRKRFEAVESQVTTMRAQAITLRDRARLLVDQDEEAYGQVAEALGLPREASERRDRIQSALRCAVRPPLSTMHVALAVVQLAAEIVPIGNKSAISDVGVGALMASAGYKAARLNVEINLAAIKDANFVGAIRDEMSTMPDPERWNADVQRHVHETIGVTPG